MSYHVEKNHFKELPEEIIVHEDGYMDAYKNDGEPIVDYVYCAEKTCKMVTSGTPCEGNTDVACTCCGAYNIGEYYDGYGHRAAPKFCPECGRMVKR